MLRKTKRIKPSKMQEFLNDPKNYLSIVAIVISGFAIWFAYRNNIEQQKNNREQNRRWDNLNIGNVVVKGANIGRYPPYTQEQMKTINFGYEVFYITNFDDSNSMMLPYSLIARDEAKEYIPGKIIHTLGEIQQMLIQIKATNKVEIFKSFKPEIVLENNGKTDVKNLNLKIVCKYFDSEWRPAFSNSSPLILSAGKETSIKLRLDFGLEQRLPPYVFYKLSMNYQDVNDTVHEKVINVMWRTQDDTWNSASPEDKIEPTIHH